MKPLSVLSSSLQACCELCRFVLQECTGGACQSRWEDLWETFQPRDLLIGGWFPCHSRVIAARVCGAPPGPPLSVQRAHLCGEQPHCEGWPLGKEELLVHSWLFDFQDHFLFI